MGSSPITYPFINLQKTIMEFENNSTRIEYAKDNGPIYDNNDPNWIPAIIVLGIAALITLASYINHHF